ncbi:MAG: HAMP domain-containing sensor histidine kinase [bacterium]|nr:HAMP domain-containing histidine kinase [Gammaproteobacteria bacterium]HIL97930.1 HAMP domain-containing histidine kinase [Pseudomonadales bacterium]
MINVFVFSKISGYYLLLSSNGEADPGATGGYLFFSADSIRPVLESKTCSREVLDGIFGQQINFSGSRYRVGEGENYLLLLSDGGPMFKSRKFNAATVEARHRVTEFELTRRERLIDALYATDTSLDEYINAWAGYFFFDHYALWVYNRFTRVFTCSTSSFTYPRSIIFEGENSALNLALMPDYQTECRAPNENRVTLGETLDIKTVNRMKLTLGYDGTIGVLTFYSRHEGFSLQLKNQLEIRNSIETKYLQVRQQEHQGMNQINQQFIETYKIGQLNEFLYGIACQVSANFQVEACSIFLADKSSKRLELRATCDEKIHGEPVIEYSYEVSSGVPTAEVFGKGEMAFSYDLMTDDPNNEGYNETTVHPPQNWIGSPLASSGQCFGVLRVRNKYELDKQGNKSIVNFSTDDFMNLLSLCSNLANLIRIETLFVETEDKLSKTNASIDEMSDFNKVFLHEIRTPISKFTMAPEIIKRTLANKELTGDVLEKVMKQLDDIQVMGDRLEFIAKTFNFNQIVTRRNFETLSVLRDIIYPVINITRAYLRKQYDIDIQLNATGLQSCRVYGDKTLLNIVFNTLIDNAGKYSIGTRKPITVSGGYEVSGDYFNITVSNYGLPIHEGEKERLFEKGVRGSEAVRHGIGGTGIGLHLAHRIMAEGNGNLHLTSLSNPVTFTIRVPARVPDKRHE